MSGDGKPFTSWLHRTGGSTNVSWWGERPLWLRHAIYWVTALGLVSISAFNDRPGAPSSNGGDPVWLGAIFPLVLILGVMALVSTLVEWEEAGLPRTISRCLVLLAFVLGAAALWLLFARHWGVEVFACKGSGTTQTCAEQASPRGVLGMLAWNAADVVPVLKITDSFMWDLPARSESLTVGVTLLMVRLWVAIGVLGVIKRIWDTWIPAESRIRKRLAAPQ